MPSARKHSGYRFWILQNCSHCVSERYLKMTNKLLKAIKDPGYAVYIFLTRYMRLTFRKKIFAHAKEYRSDSENGSYAAAVLKAVRKQKTFDNFKRIYGYRVILEHVSKDQGYEYLEILKSRDDGILEGGLDTVLVSDEIGNPIKHGYEGFHIPLSPTTLRYLKVTSDLQIMFGDQLGDVAEIGCGYGGQTLVNDQLLNVRIAKLFDLPVVTELIDKYLNAHLLRGAYNTAVINQEKVSEYDLVISNYAFSELPKKLQLSYIEKVLSKSKMGYLTMNSGLGGPRAEGKLSLGELRELLPKFEIFEEQPITHDYNYIIAWGYDDNAIKQHFKVKQP